VRLATVRLPGVPEPTTAVVEAEGGLVDLGVLDVGVLLRDPDWAAAARAALRAPATIYDPATVELAPLVPQPGKIVCVGLNYRAHITEMGRDLPDHPTLFAKWAETLVGADDPIALPPETDQLDHEVELAVVIGAPVRRARGAAAEAAIAGFAILDDVTCRDWQFRTREWLQGKVWQGTTPLGPWLVTPDELPGGVRPRLGVSLTVNGEARQSDSTADLVFDPVDLVEYVSTMVALAPGDVIATGTPGGVGHAARPPRYLQDGDVVTAEIELLGRQTNVVRAESRP
jgi:acylpyruvate hydrolase